MKCRCAETSVQEIAFFHRFSYRQRGVSLIVVLLMLIVVSMIGLSAAQIALQQEKASRHDHDRQLAMQAAEAALIDAELDIERSPRSYLFAQDSAEGFALGCGNGRVDLYLGLCRRSDHDEIPAWLAVDLANESAESRSVPYGRFTGRTIQTGAGHLPVRPPRYIIERISYSGQDNKPARRDLERVYRITAIGFGMRDSTQVMLQTFYRIASHESSSHDVPAGRFGWREIPNWKELRDALSKT